MSLLTAIQSHPAVKSITHALVVAHSLVREHIVKAATRSSKWPGVRKAFMKQFPTCDACGGTDNLQVHHVCPFHDNPELELHPDNLITLCMGYNKGIGECHVKIGHGSSFKFFNPNARQDALEALANPGKFEEICKRAEMARKPNIPGEE